MATNFDMHRGVTKVVPTTADLESGDPVRVGDLVGVLLTNEEGGYATVAFEGVLTDSSLGSESIDPGTPIYTSTAAGSNNIAVKATLTTTKSTNLLFGHTLNVRTGTGLTEIKVG